jgi:hypothetical protein
MSDFWDNARGSFNKIVGKTNKAIDAGRLQFDITQYKNKISGAQREIGKYVELKAKEGVTEISFSDEYVAGKLKDIDFYYLKIEELKEETRKIFEKKQ